MASRLFASPIPPLARLARDQSGATALIVALSMTVLMGFVAIAVDVGHWYADKRLVQGAADAAAYSAAVDSAAGDTATGVVAAARAVSASYGLTDGVGGVSVAVNVPPTSGAYASTAGAVQVVITKTEGLFFASFYTNSATISARGVAVPGSAGGRYCILALSTTPSTSISTADVSVGGGAVVDTSLCGIYVNSSGPDALYMNGLGTIIAKYLTIVGNYTLSNNSTLTVTGQTITGAPVSPDPYGNQATPAAGACNQTNFTTSGTQTISPGTYCNGFTANRGSRVTMSPGVYIIDRGVFSLNGNAVVTGTGVTVVLTSSTGSSYATMSVNGGTTFTLSAPTSGPTAGLVILQDRTGPMDTSKMNGGSAMVMTGVVYLPTQLVQYAGGNLNQSTCTILVAYRINFTGGASFNNQCSGTGATQIGSTSTSLAE